MASILLAVAMGALLYETILHITRAPAGERPRIVDAEAGRINAWGALSCFPNRPRAGILEPFGQKAARPGGRLLLADLLECATQRQFVYRHTWRPGALVIWDNRAVLHRGRRYALFQRRELRRSTVEDVRV